MTTLRKAGKSHSLVGLYLSDLTYGEVTMQVMKDDAEHSVVEAVLFKDMTGQQLVMYPYPSRSHQCYFVCFESNLPFILKIRHHGSLPMPCKFVAACDGLDLVNGGEALLSNQPTEFVGNKIFTIKGQFSAKGGSISVAIWQRAMTESESWRLSWLTIRFETRDVLVQLGIPVLDWSVEDRLMKSAFPELDAVWLAKE